jgi:hypothetical protein
MYVCVSLVFTSGFTHQSLPMCNVTRTPPSTSFDNPKISVSNPCIAPCYSAVLQYPVTFCLLGLVHTFRFSTGLELTGPSRAQLGTLLTSPVLNGRSNEQEPCDQAVVHAQWSAVDRNSVIALFLYRRRKRRRNRLHWVHPIIKKRKNVWMRP